MKYISFVFILLFFASPIDAKKLPIDYPTESKFIYDACLSKSGNVVFCTDNRNIKAFNIASQKLLGEYTNGHRDKILSIDLSPDSTLLVSGGRDSSVIIWDVQSRIILESLHFATGKITTIKFSPDSKYILIGCSNSHSYLYSIPEKKCVHIFSDEQKDVTSVAFNSYGNLIAITGADKIIYIYNTSNYNNDIQLRGHKNWVRSIAFYNDGQGLISCGDDGKIIKWKISNLKNIKRDISRTGLKWNMSVDVENRGVNNWNFYVCGMSDGTVNLYSLFAKYSVKAKAPVNKVIIVPKTNSTIEVVVATLGKGLLYYNSEYISSL